MQRNNYCQASRRESKRMSDFTGRVLVLGASGETGRAVVRSLEAHNIAVRAQVRSAEKGNGLASHLTEVVITEITPHTLPALLTDVTAIISTIGTRIFTDLRAIEAAEYTTIRQTIEATQEVSIQHFVLCSSMGTQQPESMPPLANILHAKARAEQELINSGLTYTIIHPGGLRNEEGGRDILVTPHPAPHGGSITRADTAEVLVQALLQPAARNLSVDIVQRDGQGPANRANLFSNPG
jgi:uncharacterized protein YbjT (DUF2867 family)